MTEQVSIPDHLKTLDGDLIQLLSERRDARYSPSYIARIINRSITDDSYLQTLPAGFRKGKIIDTEKILHTYQETTFSISREGKVLEYHNLSLPTGYGREIMDALDKKVACLDLEKLPKDQVLRLVVLVMIACSTAHVFPDANGRTCVGLADYYLKRCLGKGLKIDLLLKRNKELVNGLIFSSLGLLPDDYNPQVKLFELEQSEAEKMEIELPSFSTAREKDVLIFIRNFVQNVIKFIEEYRLDEKINQKFNFEDISTEALFALLRQVT